MFLVLILLVNSAHSKEYRLGYEYSNAYGGTDSQLDSEKVLEFFMYESPHSFTFHSMLKSVKQELSDHIRFEKVPVFLGRNPLLGRTYCTLVSMGAPEQLHDEIFTAIHRDKKRFRSLNDIATFLAAKGVSRQAFMATFNSHSVLLSLYSAKDKGARYMVDRMPLVVVHGKYKVQPGYYVGDYEEMLDVMKYLILNETDK